VPYLLHCVLLFVKNQLLIRDCAVPLQNRGLSFANHCTLINIYKALLCRICCTVCCCAVLFADLQFAVRKKSVARGDKVGLKNSQLEDTYKTEYYRLGPEESTIDG
jgi:hypothetical protein